MRKDGKFFLGNFFSRKKNRWRTYAFGAKDDTPLQKNLVLNYQGLSTDIIVFIKLLKIHTPQVHQPNITVWAGLSTKIVF